MTTSADSEQSTQIFRRFLEPFAISSVQFIHKDDINLVWIDRKFKDDSLGSLLYGISSSWHAFDSLTDAVGYLSDNKDKFHIFIIVSGELSDEVVQLAEHMSHVHCLFIYCLNPNKYEYLKEKSSKLIAICEKTADLIFSIGEAQKSISLNIARQYSMRDLSKESATHIWYQLLKSLLTQLTENDEESASNDLKSLIVEHYHDNATLRERNIQYLDYYESHHALFLYSSECGFYDIINTALRKQNIDLLYKSRLFIRDLSNQLSQLKVNLPSTLRVYRGSVMPKESFNRLKHTIHKRSFVSTQGYLSTTTDVSIAKLFTANDTNKSVTEAISIIYEIDIDKETDVIAADISKNSDFKQEKEILFDIDSTFEILDIKYDEEQQLYIVHMCTSMYSSKLATEYIRYNQRALLTDKLDVELLFGSLIADMGEFQKSINYFERMLTRNDINQLGVCVNLGRVYTLNGDYVNAKKYYNTAKNLLEEPNSLKLAEIMNKLGWLDHLLGDYHTAIEKYRVSLEFCERNRESGNWQMKNDLHTNIARAQMMLGLFDEAKQELNRAFECMKNDEVPDDHPDFAQHQINLGKLYQRCGDYDKAHDHYCRALEMRKRTLPPGHLDIGKVFYHMGSVIGEAGTDYGKALTYLHESLIICEAAVGEEHPETALVWSGIGNTYTCQDDHKNALKYQLKALQLCRKIFDDKDHEDTARSLNNIGELYRRMKDYPNAFLHLNEALNMRKRIFAEDHFDVGTVHINLAEAYRDIKDYQRAIEHAEQGMQAWKKKLLDSATYMKEGEELLTELRRLASQNDADEKQNR